MGTLPLPESFYALRRSDGSPVSLFADIRPAASTKEGHRALDALTLLTYACVTKAGETYAASFYSSIGHNPPRTTIMFSGGPEGVPQPVRQFLELSFLPRLRTIASTESMTHPQARDALFAEMMSFFFDYWWQFISVVDPAAWEEANVGDAEVADRFANVAKVLRALLEKGEEVKRRGATPDDYSYMIVLLEVIYALTSERRVRSNLALRDGARNATYQDGWNLHVLLDDKSMVPIDGHGILSSDGELLPNFSCSRHIVNVLAPFRYAFRLSWLVQKRRDLFADIAIVFCEPTWLEAPIDPVGACKGRIPSGRYIPTTEERSVSGYLHAPMNVLQHLLPMTASRDVVVFPALGTSGLLCRGCYDFLCAIASKHSLFSFADPIEFGRCSGKVVFPWLSPNLAAMGQCHAEVQEKCWHSVAVSLNIHCA